MAKINNLPADYMRHLIDREPRQIDAVTAELVQKRLERFQLETLEDSNPAISLPIPDGFGSVFEELEQAYQPYSKNWNKVWALVSNTTPIAYPLHFNSPLGWAKWCAAGKKWANCTPEDLPETIVLDIETVEIQKDGAWNPTCAVALSQDGWYVWRADLSKVSQVGLIPFPTDRNIIGYNVAYDRSYLDVEYLQAASGNSFYDLMAMFVVCRGMSNQQRTVYAKLTGKVDEHETDDDEMAYGFTDDAPSCANHPIWFKETSTNGLAAVYERYTDKSLNKGVRDNIVSGGISWVSANLSEVIGYCALDVAATLELARKLIPEYLSCRPSPINRHGAVALGSCWLPMDSERFPDFYQRVESEYQSIKANINTLLLEACDRFLQGIGDDRPKGSEVLDWTPALSGKNKGKPAWYRKALAEAKKGELTLKKRFIPFVLRLTYGGQTLEWVGSSCEGGWHTADGEPVPHPQDKGKRVTSLFVKDYLPLFESGYIHCPEECRAAVNQLVSAINWVQMRKRVYGIKHHAPEGVPVVLPRMVVNGTITGRATDSLWQVLPNPKKGRLGTELKTMIAAPKGYTLIGADVASQEAWLAGIHGEQQLGFNGSTPFGLMNTCGSTSTKTDIHSVVARETGMSRESTKPRVYGALYGQGIKGDSDLLLKANPDITQGLAKLLSQQFMNLFKGYRDYERGGYKYGIASSAFTRMELIADSRHPRTPLTGAYMSKSLAGISDYKPTRVNWVVQASGVDFRDMLVLLTLHFFDKLKVRGRLVLTIHDEIRCCVKVEDTYNAAYALQLAHLYVRAGFILAHRLDNIPAGVAWFPEVDIDRYLRKSPTDPSLTPSQTEPLEAGYVLTPADLLAHLTR